MDAETPSLDLLLRALKLPSFIAHREALCARAEREGWSCEQTLHALAETELEERRQRRIARHAKQSRLPPDKTLAALDLGPLPLAVRRVLPSLCEGGFVERGENVLAFGLPGRGKTHVCCAVGHELVQRGYRVLFVPAFSWGAEGRSSKEFCPSLEPGASWTKSQLDFDWTSEGTDEFLGHGVATTLRTRSPIGVWCRLNAWNP